MNSNIAKICRYVVLKNALKRERNKARAKVRYYELLLRGFGSSLNAEEALFRGIRGFKKWNKPGKLSALKALYKKHKAEQLLTEVKIAELVASYRDELRKIKKEDEYYFATNTDYIVGIDVVVNDGKFDCINLSKIYEIYETDEVERILLRDELHAV